MCGCLVISRILSVMDKKSVSRTFTIDFLQFFRVTMKTQVDSYETDKSDFFKTNSRLPKKNKSFNLVSESENEVT